MNPSPTLEGLAFLIVATLIFCLAVLGKDIVQLVVLLVHEMRVREVRVEHVHRFEGMTVTWSPNAAACAPTMPPFTIEQLT